VNKLIVTDKNYINNGNTALAPERKSSEDKRYKVKQEENEKLRKLRQSKLRSQAKVMIGIALTFTIGFTVVYRYSSIYNMEKNLSAATMENDNMNKNNENLKLQLMKNSQIQIIEDKASKLNMVKSDKNQAAYVDYNRQTLKSNNTVDSKKQKSIFQQIKDKLF
jgi:cell division protein FtsL